LLRRIVSGGVSPPNPKGRAEREQKGEIKIESEG